MEKLNNQEKEIIKAISKTTTYTDVEVWRVYDIIKSFDDTIKVLNHAVSLGITPFDMIGIVNEYK